MSKLTDNAAVLWKTIRRHWIVASLIGLYLIASILTGTVVGRVTDADTGEPIQGAVIMAHWQWDWIPFPVPPEGGTVKMNVVAETMSRKSGRFMVFRPTGLLFSYPTVIAWKNNFIVSNNRPKFDPKDPYWPQGIERPSRYRMEISLKPWEEEMLHCEQYYSLSEQVRLTGTSGHTPKMDAAVKYESDLCQEAGGSFQEKRIKKGIEDE